MPDCCWLGRGATPIDVRIEAIVGGAESRSVRLLIDVLAKLGSGHDESGHDEFGSEAGRSRPLSFEFGRVSDGVDATNRLEEIELANLRPRSCCFYIRRRRDGRKGVSKCGFGLEDGLEARRRVVQPLKQIADVFVARIFFGER
mgnify:CR=1 FL=1